jgi:uncharacterized membrane protein
MAQSPPTLDQLKQMRPPLRNVNQEHRESLAALERLALWITDHVGTMGFFLIIFVWTVLWLGWNTLAPEPLRFDPFPAFVYWLLVSDVIQLLLIPLLIVGQNLQNRHAQIRVEADFEVNAKSERELEAILAHLEKQNELLLEISRKLDRK